MKYNIIYNYFLNKPSRRREEGDEEDEKEEEEEEDGEPVRSRHISCLPSTMRDNFCTITCLGLLGTVHK